MEDASIWSRCENVFNAALTGVLCKGATATWPAALGANNLWQVEKLYTPCATINLAKNAATEIITNLAFFKRKYGKRLSQFVRGPHVGHSTWSALVLMRL